MRRKSDLNDDSTNPGDLDLCRFCYLNDDETILFQNDVVYVIPALGSFVRGYVLFIHQDHKDCFAEGMDRTIVRSKRRLRSLLEDIYDACIFYEHGRAGGCFERGNCRIDFHAHLHAVPVDVDISDVIAEDFQRIKIDDWREVATLSREHPEYLYFESENEEQYFYVAEGSVEDQYLRKRVCESLDLPTEYADWRRNPFYDTMEKTVETVEKYGSEADI